MSTSVSPANLSSSWKQEVNRRVAAHKNRKTPFVVEQESTQDNRSTPASRAAQAAARVAARYAKAPSYSEMLANEARSAVVAAEAASKAALEAQAAAQSVLASLEAASATEPTWESEPESVGHSEPVAAPVRAENAQTAPSSQNQPFAIRWEPDMPMRRSMEPMQTRASHAPGLFETDVPDWPEPDWSESGSPASSFDDFAVVEPAQPIYANLIEFPRELIAVRKVRPRRIEGPLVSGDADAQLSIFEVDPDAISTEPETIASFAEVDEPVWIGPEWSGMKLEEEPEQAFAPQQALPVQSTAALELAPVNRRLLAAVVDIALVSGACLTAAIAAATKAVALPDPHAIEFGAVFALLVVAALYQSLFFTFARATPGMRYAQVRLSTFDGQIPTRTQRNARLGAMLLSVLPVGLGLAWAIFDDDHLTWHDRLSRTYLRKY